MHARQRSFDDLGTPLHEVTFCIFDLETTGGNPDDCEITEIGAVKVRGGEVLGTFQTLINPGCAVPPRISMLTGITDQLVMRAPSIDQVLPSFLEFLGGAVVVGHNVRFDWAFLTRAVRRVGGPMLGNQRVDTLGLARRLLADETPRFGLDQLVRHLRLPHAPTHRALDDAIATTDLLHALIERAGSWGVHGLDDLVALPSIAGNPQWRKLRLTDGLPRRPGVYLFRDEAGQVLYVGKATDLRSRVRSYFSTDRRRKIGQLLRETSRIDHRVCTDPLEAELLEIRLIRRYQPRFNRRGRRVAQPRWVALTAEAFPRLTVTRTRPDDRPSLGPFRTHREAGLAVEAIQGAIPIRRCTTRIPRRGGPLRAAPCAAAQLGVATCPCSGATGAEAYATVVADVAAALEGDARRVLGPLDRRLAALADGERFEEAATVRDRAAAYRDAVARRHRMDGIRSMERAVLERPDGSRIVIEDGRVRSAVLDMVTGDDTEADELLCIARFLDANVGVLRLVEGATGWTSLAPALPSYRPAPNRAG